MVFIWLENKIPVTFIMFYKHEWGRLCGGCFGVWDSIIVFVSIEENPV